MQSCEARLLLQALQQAGEYIVPPAAAVAATLHVMLKHDIKQQDSGMSAATSNLLNLWQQCCLSDPTHQLAADSTSMLAVLFIRDKRWNEAADTFQSCVNSNQVCMLQHPLIVPWALSVSCHDASKLNFLAN